MIKEYIKFGLNSLRHRKLRSFLTVIGIVIGIAAVVSLITISSGLNNAVKSQFEQMGSDRIYVTPKIIGTPSSMQGLTIDDLRVVENLPEVDYAIPLMVKNSKIEYQREIKNTNVIGWPEEYVNKLSEDYGIQLETGDYFGGSQKYAALVGFLAADKLFDDEVKLRSKILINNQEFKVAGILKEIGNPDDDNNIYIPLATAREIFNDEESVTAIDLKIKSGIEINSAVDKIKKKLENARGNDNFDVYTSEQLLEQIGSILGILQIVIGGIAAISLVVGGIGIMNSMFTSVLERTREIGIMKSIGATRKDILSIFIIESGFIGFIGGVIGVLLGIGVSLLVGLIAKQANFQLLKIMVDYQVVLFGLIFSVIIGGLSGVVPAYNASKLRPVEALK